MPVSSRSPDTGVSVSMSRPSRRSHSIVFGSERRASCGARGASLGSRSGVFAAFRRTSACAVAIPYSCLLVETAIDRALHEGGVEHLREVIVLHRGDRRAEGCLSIGE